MIERLTRFLETQKARPLSEDDARACAPVLAGALQAARRSQQAVELEPEAFVAFVLERVQPGLVHPQLERLDLVGLHLTAACLLGQHAAHLQFERDLGDTIRRALTRLDLAPAQIEEIHQRVRLRLLTPPHVKLAAFSGRGSLRNWVRAVAFREGLGYRRRLPAEHDSVSGLADEVDPELLHLRTKYGDAFNSALREALQSLDDEQRLMLKLRVKDGLTLEQTAAVIGVHRSSVARRLAAAHETIWRHTKRELVAQRRIDPREFESVLRLVRSHLHLSLSSVL